MNMVTVRNLVVISDTSFVKKVPCLGCRHKMTEKMTELRHLTHGASRKYSDHLPHRLQVFKICVVQFQAYFVKNNIEN
jgi:cytidine deaminase